MGCRSSASQIRGLAVVFGVRLPRALSPAFIAQALRSSEGIDGLSAAMRGLIGARTAVLAAIAAIDTDIKRMVRTSDACRRLMTIPGVGQLTALAFAAAVDEPERFKRSRDIGPYLGLVPRRYQSGEVDYDGHISRRGDTHLRGLLYEAATVILTRTSAESSLRSWGLRLREKIGFKRAAVAVARKLAVVMHAMLRSGQLFDRTAGVAA